MDKKTAILISTITTAVAATAIGLITHFVPAHASAINAAIETVSGAIITCVNLFVANIAAKLAAKK